MRSFRRWISIVALVVASALVPVRTAQPPTVLADCPPQGDATATTGSDPDLNVQKNRTDVPASFADMHFDDLANLDVPDGVSKRHRTKWPQAARDAVAAEEIRAVTLIGFLVAQKLEGTESCNCHSENEAERDIHLWLGNDSAATKADAIVVEVSPRVRALHPTWTGVRLRQLAAQKARLRVSGWLLMDEEHPDEVGRSRATTWEVHPIMKIEIRVGNQWVEL
jgi:hypothetical protein